MKILIAGKDGGSSEIIREALNLTDYEIQLIHVDHVFKGINGYSADLLILDLTDVVVSDLKQFSFIPSLFQKTDIPVLAFTSGNQENLKKELQKSGISKTIELPYSHSEVRLLIENCLKQSVHPEAAKINESPTGITTDNNYLFLQLSKTLSQNEVNFGQIITYFINYLSRFIKRPHYLLFSAKKISDAIIVEKENVETVDVSDRFNLAELISEKTIKPRLNLKLNLNNFPKKQNFIKTYFGVLAKSLLICPFFSNEKLHQILLVFSADRFFLSEEQTDQLEAARKFIELKLNNLEMKNILTDFEVKYSKERFLFFQNIIDQFNFGIIVFTRDLKLKYINKEGKRLLQLEKDSKVYESLNEILGENNTSAIINSMETEDGAFQRPEIEITTPAGQRLLIGFTLTEFTDPLDEEGYILSLKDITYTKELQEEILRMDRLASLGVMASGIAHEIRNPLAGIKAIAQTFEDELSKDDPKNEYVRRIIKQVNRLDELLKSLFSYAKPQKPNRQFFRVSYLLQDVLSLLKRKIQNQNIKLIQNFDKDLQPVFVDNGQIQQVIFNLLLNSIEAIEKNGEIFIEVSRVDPMKSYFQRKPFINKITENPYVLITIKDNGCGISAENLQQIFNPFFTTKNFGTGLGLSIVYQIVQENNGIIYYESSEGRGTECFLFLPAFEPFQKTAP